VKGFGVRITSAGAKAFILNYRAAGRERRITIGSFPDWSVADARNEARGLKRRIDVGEDPMADRHADRSAPTMNDLADRFDAEHVAKRRPKTQSDYRSIVRLYVRPTLGVRKVAEVRHTDIERLHAHIVKTSGNRGRGARTTHSAAVWALSLGGSHMGGTRWPDSWVWMFRKS
jgi:hypothetical protein